MDAARSNLTVKRNLRGAVSSPAKMYTNNLKLELEGMSPKILTQILTKNRNETRGINVAVNRVNNLPKPASRPKLVVKWGPPASGKGSARMRAAIEKLGDPYNSYIHINIDALVESTQYFTNKSRSALINLLTKKGINNYRRANYNTITSILNRLSDAEARTLGSAYGTVRSAKLYTTLNNGIPVRTGRSTREITLSNKQDALLDAALSLGKNVSVETTGAGPQGWPGWLEAKLQQARKLGHNYQFVFIFPLVPFGETWRRYKSRPVQSFLAGGGFRFASSRRELMNTYRASYINFRDILDNPGQYEKIDRIIVIHPESSNSNVNFILGKNSYMRTARARGSLRLYLSKFIQEKALKNVLNLNTKLDLGLRA